MKHLIFLFSLTIFFFGCEKAGNDPVFDYNKKSAILIATNNNFGLTMLNTIIENEEKPNIMISPASVSLALGMAYNGAETNTKEAFESVLNYEGLTRDEVNAISLDLINTLVTDAKDNKLEIANSIWYHQDFPVYQSFIDLNRTYFSAEVEELDFLDIKAVERINSWVADKTHDKIEKIIEELSPDARLLLINALYFNCLWEYEFDPDKTKAEAFYNEDGSQLDDVTMMTTQSTFNYVNNEDYTAVELPYIDEKFSMHLILPATGTGVDELIGQLDGDKWNELIDSYQKKNDVQVTVPKFKFAYERSMKDDLTAMGLGIAFTEQADFSGISEIELLISRVIHKTYIDVNEEGTEAAAVTAVEFNVTSVGPETGPIIVRFDRPFLFAITEKTSRSIVFIGRLMEPELAE